ncbi:MAG: hypothetical protein BWY13_00141 [Euryarchaeota archaeon ADurb.Bin190]|nr:MAG: hypothetical protein BWY13_00141 [Euryarchaeota archaeon ADurb.Bin190]
MRDDDYGQIQLPIGILYGIQNLLFGGGTGHGSGLVQEQDLGLLGQLPGYEQPLLLTTGKDGGQMVGLLLQAHQTQIVKGLLVKLIVIVILGNGQNLVAGLPGIDPPHYIFQSALCPEGKVPLQMDGCYRHLLSFCLIIRFRGDDKAVQEDPAPLKALHAPQDLHKGALAPSAFSHQPQYLSRLEGEADVL